MKKKLLVFLGIFVFMIIPKNVYASQVFPWTASIGGVNYSNTSSSNSNYYWVNATSSSPASVNISVKSYDYDALNIDESFGKYPYILVYFQTWNSDSEIGITKNTSCTTSCFNNLNVVMKKIGTNAISGKNQYVMILQAKKWAMDCGVGSGQCIYSIDDTFTFSSTYSGTRNFEFLNIVLSDTNNIDSVSDFSSIVNNANNNTTNIINTLQQSQDQTHDDLQDLNDTMKSEEAPTTNDVSDKTSEWSNKLAGTGPVSQMVLMPITLLNGYVSGMNATCQPYNLGSLMGTDIVLPCINVSNYLGATLWNVIDILFSGFMIYAIGKKFVKIFNDFTNLRDNQIDDLYGGGK